MEQKNYLKLFWLAGFIGFAGVSCWATSESFHLLLPSWPLAACWIVTIGVFIIASIGSKLIVDSLNGNIYMEGRGGKLVLGIILLLLFWLVFSMPTNTHTFFYRSVIADKVNNDIATTRGYLGQIKNNTHNKNQAALKVNELKNTIDVKLGELEAEIMNEANPGFGPKSKEILRQFATLLSVDKIDQLSFRGTSKQDRQKLCDAYRAKIYTLAETKAQNIVNHILTPNPDNLKEARTADKNLELMKQYIGEKKIDLNNAEDIEDVCDKLNLGYNIVKKNRDFVNFSSQADERLYTADNPVTKVKRMISVFDVWEDFTKGDFAGHGFAFWIIIAVLIDVAAFIFFDLAFKREE